MTDRAVTDRPVLDAAGGVRIEALPAGFVQRLDHVAIAVPDLRAAVRLFCDVLGGEFVVGGEDTALGIRTIQLRFAAGSKVELMTPVRADSYLQGYLDRHGPGFHHVALFVDDLTAAVARLQDEGYEVVGIELGRPDWNEAFLRPRSAFGTLVQLVETTVDWADFQTDLTLEQVLDGDVVWAQSTPVLRDAATPPPAATPARAVTPPPAAADPTRTEERPA